MKMTIANRTTTAVALAAFLATAFVPAAVCAETRIGLVDLKKIFEGYWKTKQADAQLKDRAADLDKARKSLIEDFQKANEEYKKLIEGTNDQAISGEERDKRKSAAEKKLIEIKEIEQTIKLFDQNSRENLGTQQRRMREKILDEIKELVSSKGKSGGYSMVLDIAAETPNQTPIVLYNNGENDLTTEVLTQLNSTAPTGALAPTETKEKENEKATEEKK
jgi:outer membrane protein